MHKEKIQTALSKAMKYLEDSLKVLSSSGGENAASDSLWSATAETEYAVLLLSLTLGDRLEGSSWKHSSSSQQSMEFKPTLASALELLKNAKVNIEANNFEKGYEETWTARNQLLKIQELLEKKRKEAKK